MALFKILKGNEANLPGGPSPSNRANLHHGWAYVTDTGKTHKETINGTEVTINEGCFYVDVADDDNGTNLRRLKVGGGRAELANKAINDSEGASIRDTYISTLAVSLSDGTNFKFVGKDADDNVNSTITVPNHDKDHTGLITNVAQDIYGAKTFKTVGFEYSAIESASADAARPVWFAYTGKVGRPVYNNNFTYNPSTGTLKCANFDGLAATATADEEGDNIRDTYISTLNQNVSNATSFSFVGKDADGNINSTIDLPIHDSGIAGLITDAAQTIYGSKTFNETILFSAPTGSTYPNASKGLMWSGAVDTGNLFYELQSADTEMLVASFGNSTKSGLEIRSSADGVKTTIVHGVVTSPSFVGNLTGLASNALMDQNDQVIDTHYLSKVGMDIASNTKLNKIEIYMNDGNGNEITDFRFQIPNATDEDAGLMTADADQSLFGRKTFTSKKTVGGNVVYSQLIRGGESTNFIKGRDKAFLIQSSVPGSGYAPFTSIKTKSGSWETGTYDNTSYTDELIFCYGSDTNYTANNNDTARIRFMPNGRIFAPSADLGAAKRASAIGDDYKLYVDLDAYVKRNLVVATSIVSEGTLFFGSSASNYSIDSQGVSKLMRLTVADTTTLTGAVTTGSTLAVKSTATVENGRKVVSIASGAAVGSSSKPVYIDASGHPIAINTVGEAAVATRTNGTLLLNTFGDGIDNHNQGIINFDFDGNQDVTVYVGSVFQDMVSTNSGTAPTLNADTLNGSTLASIISSIASEMIFTDAEVAAMFA